MPTGKRYKKTRELCEQVMTLAAGGECDSRIAEATGIARTTLQRNYESELEMGRATIESAMQKVLVRNAMQTANYGASTHAAEKALHYINKRHPPKQSLDLDVKDDRQAERDAALKQANEKLNSFMYNAPPNTPEQYAAEYPSLLASWIAGAKEAGHYTDDKVHKEGAVDWAAVKGMDIGLEPPEDEVPVH